MRTLVITAGGFGSIYSFDDERAAKLHPITHYGDAILQRAEDLPQLYNDLEWSRLARMAGLELPEATLEVLKGPRRRALELRESMSLGIWDLLVKRAAAPPTDYNDLCTAVARDRLAYNQPDTKKDTRHVNTATDTADIPATDKTRAAARPASDLPDHGTLHFLNDKEGKPYSPTNHPFREGSNRAGRFAHYTDGVTVAGLLKAGLTRRQIHDHIDAGLVELRVDPANAPAPQEQPAA